MSDLFKEFAQEQDSLTQAPGEPAAPPPAPQPLEDAPAPDAPATPAPSPFADFAAEQDRDRQVRIQRFGEMRRSLVNPDRQAAVLSISRQTGLDPNFVEHEFDFWKARVGAPEQTDEQAYAQNPELARYALENPWIGEVVTKDKPLNSLQYFLRGLRRFVGFTYLDDLDRAQYGAPQFYGDDASFLRTFDPAPSIPGEVPGVSPKVEQVTMQKTPLSEASGLARTGIYADAAKRSFEPIELGWLTIKYAAERLSGSDTYETQKAALALRNKSIEPDYQAGPFEQIGLDAAQFIGSHAVSLGTTLLGTGVATKVLGFGAKAAAGVGGGLGFGTSFVMEASSFWDMKNQVDDQGRPVDDDVALGAALGYAAVSAAIETGFNVEKWLPFFKSAGKEASKKAVKEFLEQIAKDPVRSSLLRAGLRNWAKTAAEEGLEEAVQGLAEDIFSWYARGRSSALRDGGTFTPQKVDVVGSLGDAFDTWVTATVGSFVMAGAPAARRAFVMDREAQRSVLAARQMMAVHQAAGASPTAQAAPEAFARAVQYETEASGSPVDAAHIDPEGVVRLAQEQHLDPAALLEEAIGPEAAKAFQEALSAGSLIRVPLAEYVDKWHKSGLADVLINDTTTRAQGVPTPRQRAQREKDFDKAVEEELKLLEDEKDAPTEYEALLSKIADELVAATPGRTKTDAKTQTAIWRAMVKTEAARNGMERDDVARILAVKIAADPKTQGIARVQSLVQGARTEQALRNDSPEFRAWFKGSKVVDESGAPLVVFRGLARDEGGNGVWWTDRPDTASGYAEGRAQHLRTSAPNVTPAYLALKNPLVVDAKGATWDAIPFPFKDEDGVEHIGESTTQEVADWAKENGHDGVIFRNVTDMMTEEGGVGTVYAAFDPGAAKSINNRGTFSALSGNILDQQAKALLDNVVAALGEENPSPNAEVVPSPLGRFEQLERNLEFDEDGNITKASLKGSGFDDYLAATREWMEKRGYTEKEIKKHLAGLKGQLKIFMALGARDLTLLPGTTDEAKKENKKGPIRKNVDPIYKISFDASAMCVKRLEASATQAYVQEKLGRPLTASERIALVAFFKEAGKTAPCLYCYVESPRAKAGDFIARAMRVVTGEEKLRKGAKKAEKAAAKKAIEQFKRFRLKAEDINPNYLLDPDTARTADAQKAIAKYGDIYDYLAQQGLYAKANQPKLYAEYRSHILGVRQSLLDELNKYAGFRFFSTSDFQAEHVIDLIQAFQDLSLRKARAHAYTKVADFVRIFGRTGMKIQMSVFAQSGATIKKTETGWQVVEKRGDGTTDIGGPKVLFEAKFADQKGKTEASRQEKAEQAARNYFNSYIPPGGFLADTWQGMDWGDAQKFREQFKNVGSVFVATSDAQVAWALDQPWIDYIIPFHYSGLEKKYYEQLGWDDFTSTQTEEKVHGTIREKNGKYEVMFYGEVIGTFDKKAAAGRARKEHLAKLKVPPGKAKKIRMWELGAHEGVSNKEMTRRYLELARKRGLEPVFAKFADHPNYSKLKKDYARSDTRFDPVNAGRIDMDEAGKVLETVFQGTAPKAKVDKKIGNRLMRLIRAGADELGVATLKALEAGVPVEEVLTQLKKKTGAAATPRGRTLVEQGDTSTSLRDATEWLAGDPEIKTVGQALDALADDRSHGDDFIGSAAASVAQEMFDTSDADELQGNRKDLKRYVVKVFERAAQERAAQDATVLEQSDRAGVPWYIPDTPAQFMALGAEGRLHPATGEVVPGEEQAQSPFEVGVLNGYSMQDIAHFYLVRRGVFPALDGRKPPKMSPAVKASQIRLAMEAFIDDAAYAPKHILDMAEGRAPVTRLEQPAYQGSPARGIEKMSTDFIGSGQGAASYGWGLYFAQSLEVARQYYEELRGAGTPEFFKDGKPISEEQGLALYFAPGRIVEGYGGPDKVVAFHTAEENLARGRGDWWTVQVQAVDRKGNPLPGIEGRIREHRTMPDSEALRDFLWTEHGVEAKQGQIYKVEVPESKDLLSWDLPMIHQSATIRQKVARALNAAGVGLQVDAEFDTMLGEDIYRVLAEELFAEETAGAEVESREDRGRAYELASKALMKAGIPGLRYLDQASRRAAGIAYGTGPDGKEGYYVRGTDRWFPTVEEASAYAATLATHNFVIWDENAVAVMSTLHQPAYHGTPHAELKGGKFSVKYILSGEGSLMEGWGLYFTQVKEIADWYRSKLSGQKNLDGITYDGKAFRLPDGLYPGFEENVFMWIGEDGLRGAKLKKRVMEHLKEELAYLEEFGDEDTPAESADTKARIEENRRAMEWAKKTDFKKFDVVDATEGGRVYKVEVPEAEDLLDRHKSVGDQPASVKEALKKADLIPVWTARQATVVQRTSTGAKSQKKWVYEAHIQGRLVVQYEARSKEAAEKNAKDGNASVWEMEGGDLYAQIAKSFESEVPDRYETAKAASMALKAAGIPGLRYWTGDDRWSGPRVLFEGQESTGEWDVDMALLAIRKHLLIQGDMEHPDLSEAIQDYLKEIDDNEKDGKLDANQAALQRITVQNIRGDLALGEPNYNFVIWDDRAVALLDTVHQEQALYRGRPAVEGTPEKTARFGPAWYYADDRRVGETFAKYRGDGAVVDEFSVELDKYKMFDDRKVDTKTPEFQRLVADLAADLDLNPKQMAARLQRKTSNGGMTFQGGLMSVARMLAEPLLEERRAAMKERQELQKKDIDANGGDWAKTPTVKDDDPRLSEKTRKVLASDSVSPWPGQDILAQYIRDAGYDGIIIENESYDDDVPAHTEFAFFKKPTAKLAKLLQGNEQNDQNTRVERAPGPRGWLETARVAGKRIANIFLTEKADFSTFLHESGHAFWELKADLAERPDAPAQVKADFEAALKWMGVQSRAELDQRSADANAIRAVADAERRALTDEERAEILRLVEPFEKWARGFEAYLMEGKAPSLALAGAFAQFKLWLKELYKSIRGLRVELDDEIRGVFDRMLATDEEIAKAAKQIGISGPAVEAAKSRAEVAALQDVARVHEAWWKKALAAEKAKAEDDYEKLPERRAWRFLRRGDGTDDLKALGRVKLDYGAVASILGSEVADRLFKGITQRFDPKTGEGGIHPDALAALLQAPSGKALLEAMVAMPAKAEWTKARADEAMRTKHPGILDERARLDALVQKALHDEPAIVDALHKDWAEDQKEAGGDAVPSVEAARAAARVLIGRQIVQGVEPRKYQKAERAWAIKRATLKVKATDAKAALAKAQKAFADAEAALKDGKPKKDETPAELQARIKELDEKLEKAKERLAKAEEKHKEAALAVADASRRRLLNFYLWKEAQRASKEHDSTRELAAKMLSAKGQERLGTAFPVLRDMTLRLLEATGFVKNIPPEAKQAGFAELMAAFDSLEPDGEGASPEFDPLALQALLTNPKAFDDLTVAQAAELRAALLQIRAASREKNTILDGDRRRLLAEVVGDIGVEASRLPAVTKPYRDRMLAKLTQSKFWEAVRGWQAMKRDPLTTWLDDEWLGQTTRRLIRDRYYTQRGVEDELLRSAGKAILDAWGRMPAAMQARMGEAIDASMLPMTTGREGPVSRSWMYQVLANLGNAQNTQRLLEGRGWTMEQVRELFIANKLTREEAEFVQSLWDFNDQYLWPKIAEVYTKVKGSRPAKVEAQPLQLILAGPGGREVVNLRGGYYPLMADPVETEQGARQERDAGINEMSYEQFRASLLQGFTKGRVTQAKYVVRLDDFGVYPTHVARVIRYIAWEEYVRDVNRLLNGLKPVILERLGKPAWDQLQAWLKVIATGQPDSVAAVDAALGAVFGPVVNRTVKAAMLINLKNALADLTTPLLRYFTAEQRAMVHGGYLTKGLLEATGGLFLPQASGHGFSLMRQRALERFSELASRRDKVSRKVRKAFDRISANGKRWQPGKSLGITVEPGRALDFVEDHGYIFQETAAVWGETIVADAAYLAAGGDYSKPIDTKDAVELEARRLANDAVQKTFPSDRAAERSRALRSKGLMGAFTMMQGFFNKLENMVVRRMHPAMVEFANAEGWLEKGKVAGAHSVTTGFALAGIFTVAGLLAQIVEGRGPEPGEDVPEWVKRKLLAFPLILDPVLTQGSSFLEAAVAQEDIRGRLKFQASERAAPAVSTVLRLFNNLGAIVDSDKPDEKRFWAAYEALMLVIGGPVSQVKRTGRAITEGDPTLQSLIYGPEPKGGRAGDLMQPFGEK